jgi:hypothetical protein
MRPKTLIVIFGCVAIAATVAGQDPPFRQVDNPFQEGAPYRIGTGLVPSVEIDGLRWIHARVDTQNGTAPVAGRENSAFATLRFDNRNKRAVNLTVVLMLEDSSGSELERLVFLPIRLGGNRTKEFRQKFKISGDDLLSTRKIYLFCKVD